MTARQLQIVGPLLPLGWSLGKGESTDATSEAAGGDFLRVDSLIHRDDDGN